PAIYCSSSRCKPPPSTPPTPVPTDTMYPVIPPLARSAWAVRVSSNSLLLLMPSQSRAAPSSSLPREPQVVCSTVMRTILLPPPRSVLRPLPLGPATLRHSHSPRL